MEYCTQPITFQVKRQSLSGVLYIPKSTSSRPGVVMYHGRGSSKKRYTDRAEMLAKAGFVTLVFDFRGCGESEGSFEDQTIAMGFEDARAGFDFLIGQERVDPNRVGVYGGSFGGYHAVLVSEQRSVKSLMLEAPAVCKDEWWNITPESIEETRRSIYREINDIDSAKVFKSVEKYAGNVLIIEHEHDEIIPKRMTHAYYNHAIHAIKRELKVFKDAPHALHDEKLRSKSNKLTVDWFTETL